MKPSCIPKLFFLFIFFQVYPQTSLYSQSLELMVGDKRIFADVQYIKAFDEAGRWTLFSRTRGSVNYDNETDLFSGVFLSYTTKSGFGGSLTGRIGASGAGSDIGPHFFKATKNFSIFAVATVALQSEQEFTWFSIARYTPQLSENWKLYTSVELFFLFDEMGVLFGTQRLRLGVTRDGYSFGLGNNVSEFGRRLSNADNNFGVFVKKAF